MATTKFYLDTRSVKKGEPAPLKITITLHGKSALLPLNIKLLPSQWDTKTAKISNHPNKNFLNTYRLRRKLDINIEFIRMKQDNP